MMFSKTGNILFIFSHIVIAIYWATLSNQPQVTRASKLVTQGTVWKNLSLAVPYFPTLLPVLLFCRNSELKLDLYKIKDAQSLPMISIKRRMIEERIALRNTAVDLKIIGK